MYEEQTTIVIKIGGAEGVDFSAICQDAVQVLAQGMRLVFVHGGSSAANDLGIALGNPPRFITSPSGYSSRYTDLRTLEIFTMAVKGKINTSLVSQLQGLGINALGLGGMDGQLMTATRKEAIQSVENGKRKIIRDDFSGKIDTVNFGLLNLLLDHGYTPVIAPLAISQHGENLNVDADRAAAMVAASLACQTLILLTAAPGLMRSFPDETTLLDQIPVSGLEKALEYAQGRMKKKILGAKEALAGMVIEGVNRSCQRVIIADGRVQDPITRALQGKGTVIQ